MSDNEIAILPKSNIRITEKAIIKFDPAEGEQESVAMDMVESVHYSRELGITGLVIVLGISIGLIYFSLTMLENLIFQIVIVTIGLFFIMITLSDPYSYTLHIKLKDNKNIDYDIVDNPERLARVVPIIEKQLSSNTQ